MTYSTATTSTPSFSYRAKLWWSTYALNLVAVTLVLIVVASIFVISFASLSELAEFGNIPGQVAWLWPVAVDGTITAATVVYFVVRNREAGSAKFTLGTLITFAGVSILGNVAHGLLADAGAEVAGYIRSSLIVFINLVPPVGLLLTVHILASLMTSHDRSSETSEAEGDLTEVAVPEVEVAHEQAAPVPSAQVEPLDPSVPDSSEPVLSRASHDVDEQPEPHEESTPAAQPVLAEPTESTSSSAVAQVREPNSDRVQEAAAAASKPAQTPAQSDMDHRVKVVSQARELIADGASQRAAAEELGVPRANLSRWLKAAEKAETEAEPLAMVTQLHAVNR